MLQELETTVDSGRLRQCVEEFARLSRSDVTAEQFFRKFIPGVVLAIRARGMAMWVPSGQEFQVAGAVGIEETDYGTDPRQKEAIIAAVREAAGGSRQPVIVPPGDPEAARQAGRLANYKPFAFLYVPIISGEGTNEVTLLGLMQLWLPTGFDPRRYGEVIAFMQSMAREAAVFLRARRIETMAAGNARLQKMLLYVTELSGQYDMKRLGTVLVNWARDITGCDRCAFFAADSGGKLSAVAVSNVEVVNPKSALVQLQLKLAQETLDAMEPTLFKKASPKTVMRGDISDYFVLSHATEALAVPLMQDKQKLGVLLAESHKDRELDTETQNVIIAVANRAIKPVTAAREIQQLPMLKTMRKAADVRRRLTESGPKRLMFKYGIPLAIIALIAVFPMRLMVRSDCLLVPKVHGVAVSEVGGRVRQVFVHEGDAVTQGQPIAKIDDEDLLQNLRLAEEEQKRNQIEANRAEAAGDEGARQIDLVEADRSGRQIDLLKLEIARTWIKCPISGVILTKDIEMLTGSVIPVGMKFCEIGDFQHWQVVSKVAESEIGLVETRLRQGPLTMSFVLNSAPGREVEAVIPNEQSISPVSSAVPGANVFLVRADFDETPQLLSALKSGYGGRSKIPLDRRPALYLALRKFINYLRVRWFF